MTAHAPSERGYSTSGGMESAQVLVVSNGSEPSQHGHPKLSPGRLVAAKAISPRRAFPASPTKIAPDGGSIQKRHGFRSPSAQISGRAEGSATNGLSEGTAEGSLRRGSIRRIVPSRLSLRCAKKPGGWRTPLSPS